MLLNRGAIRALLVLVLLAAPAGATPVDVWFDGVSGFGIESQSVTDAIAAGVPVIATPDQFIYEPNVNPPPPPHFSILATPSEINLAALPSGPTKAAPAEVQVGWTITALDRSYEDLWIVFRGHGEDELPVPADYYDTALIGLGLDAMAFPHALVLPDPVNFPGVVYVALYLGDVAQDDSTLVPVDYRLAQDLYEVGTDRGRLPVLSVGFMEQSLPEPALLLLLAPLAFVALRRR
jgi:hypothetical protein